MKYTLLAAILLLTGCNYICIKDSSNIHIELQDEFTRDGNTDGKISLK